MTTGQRILELFAAHRALAETPQAWQEVSLGSLTPEQAASVMSGVESPALIERSKALFAPPSVEKERAIRARVLEHAAPAKPAWLAGGGALALAAALVLALSLPAPQEHPPLGAAYQLELSAEWTVARGAARPEPTPGSIPMFRRDQRVSFTLRPQVAIAEAELEVVVLARDELGRHHRLGSPRRLATTTGTVRFAERLDALGLTPGRWELVLVVGRPGQVPTEPERVAPSPGTPGHDHYAVSRVTIHVLDDDGS
jgi:hypothetical protein